MIGAPEIPAPMIADPSPAPAVEDGATKQRQLRRERKRRYRVRQALQINVVAVEVPDSVLDGLVNNGEIPEAALGDKGTLAIELARLIAGCANKR